MIFLLSKDCHVMAAFSCDRPQDDEDADVHLAPAAAGSSDPAAPLLPEFRADLVARIFDGFGSNLGQDNRSPCPTEFLRLFESFLAEAGEQPSLAASLRALANGRCETAVKYFTEFGCALVAAPSPGLGRGGAAELALTLLALDGWTFSIRGSSWSSASSGSPPDVSVGTVLREDYARLVSDCDARIEKARAAAAEDKSKRSAAGGRQQGFQKTPPFVHAVLQDALKGGAQGPGRSPRGSFTDVGQHTGSVARPTAWPLASAVIRFLLERSLSRPPPPPETFDRLMADFDLWLVELALKHGAASSDDELPLSTANVASMLDRATFRTAALADAGVALGSFEARAEAARRALLQHEADQAQAHADCLVLPLLIANDEDGTVGGQPFRLPVLEPPPPRAAEAGATSLAAARALAQTNLVPLLLLPDETASPAAVLSWLKAAQAAAAAKKRMASPLLASGFESWLFRRAARMLPAASAGAVPAEVAAALVRDLQDILAALELYRCDYSLLVANRSHAQAQPVHLSAVPQ